MSLKRAVSWVTSGGPRRRLGARREVALAEPRGGVDEPIDRDRHLTGEAEADHEHHEERDEPDADEHQPAPADASVDVRRRVRDAHRADDTVAGHDGDREVEDVGEPSEDRDPSTS